MVGRVRLDGVEPFGGRDVPRDRSQLRLDIPQVFRRAPEPIAQDAKDFPKNPIGDRQLDLPVLGQVEQRLGFAPELKSGDV